MAAKKADDVAISPVQKAFAELLGEQMPTGDPTDQKFLKAVLSAQNELNNKQWEKLPDEAQDWAIEAAEAVKNREQIPLFPGVDAPKDEKPIKVKKSKSKKAAEVETAAEASDEQEEPEDEEEKIEVKASEEVDEESASEDNDETQGKEPEMAKTTKTKRGTKAAKEAKPQKRAATEAKAKKPKANGHAAARGIDTVTELVWRNPAAKLETVVEKAKAAGVKTSEQQIGVLFKIAHKNVDIAKKLGKADV